MEIKKQEFLALKQGRSSVMEYVYEFNHLARYAPEDVATDMAKQAKFRRGLSEELKDKLSIADFPDFQTLVDKAIVAEHAARELMDSRKRKWETYKTSRPSSSRPRFGQSQGYHSHSSAPPRSPAPVPRPSQAVPQSRAPASQQGGPRNPAAGVTCFSCN